jgi:phosphoserine phosphatase
MRVRPYLRKGFQPLIAEFKKQGYVTVAVSGTLQQFCDLIKNEFDLDYAIGTQLCIKGGYYDGSWEGEILEGTRKAEFISKFACEHNVDLEKSICYGDSHADAPSLELSGKSIVVAPDRKLLRIARKKGWEILNARIS